MYILYIYIYIYIHIYLLTNGIGLPMELRFLVRSLLGFLVPPSVAARNRAIRSLCLPLAPTVSTKRLK